MEVVTLDWLDQFPLEWNENLEDCQNRNLLSKDLESWALKTPCRKVENVSNKEKLEVAALNIRI